MWASETHVSEVALTAVGTYAVLPTLICVPVMGSRSEPLPNTPLSVMVHWEEVELVLLAPSRIPSRIFRYLP